MEKQAMTYIESIRVANKEMLDYFNDSFLNALEDIQDLKTQAFEIDIKIDELEKTKDLYAFKSSSKKSVFSPSANDGIDNERGRIIDTQIQDLLGIKETLGLKIRSTERSLESLKKKLQVLSDAETAIKEIFHNYPAHTSEVTNKEDDFEFIELDPTVDPVAHGYNILMQTAFDNTYVSTMLDKDIKVGIDNLTHKLEMLSYLLGTDVARAKLTLQEIILASTKISGNVTDICDHINCHVDSTKPIWSCLDEFIMEQRELHPECLIDADVTCASYETSLHPVFTINMIKLLTIFFDNIFKHAQANSVSLKIEIANDNVAVSIKDNGIGIPRDYLTKSPWYSSLHKAHEIIYLLSGSLQISGDRQTGTQITFHFPVKG